MNTRFLNPNPVILAHRGDSARCPENTLPAFISAEQLGVDVIETDVHLSSDGQVVIFHDDLIDRATNGTGCIEQYTFRQLQDVDAGFNFTPDGGKTFPFRGTGVKLLKLEEALERLPHMRFNVDLKQDDRALADAFCSLVLSMKAQDRVLCASFHAPVLRYVRSAYPQIATSFSGQEVKRLLLFGKLHLPIPRKLICGIAVQVPIRSGAIRVVTAGFIKRCHELSLSVQVWTVNDGPTMRQLLDMGVDGIFTDDPRLLKKVVEAQKQESRSSLN
jgi:glycerophosphoryl diester phosphodiesterase